MATSKRVKRYKLVDAACDFWFSDNDQARSPFPAKIHDDLKQNAQREYLLWLKNLTQDDRGDVDDDELATIFEQLLFGEALKLVGDEDTDLILTINYPFMPRVGDVVNDLQRGASTIERRELEQKEDGKLYMRVFLASEGSNERWETEFAIPA